MSRSVYPWSPQGPWLDEYLASIADRIRQQLATMTSAELSDREALSAHLVTAHRVEPLELDDTTIDTETKTERVQWNDPRYRRPDGSPRHLDATVYTARITLRAGDPKLLLHRPRVATPPIDPRAHWNNTTRCIEIAFYQEPHDQSGSLTGAHISGEDTNIRSLATAANQEVESWNDALPKLIAGLVDARRAEIARRESASERLPFLMTPRVRGKARLSDPDDTGGSQ